jgi:hypothetical protein
MRDILKKIALSKRTHLAIAFTLGAAAGGSGAYFGMRKRLSDLYDERLAEELDKTKTYYTLSTKEGYSRPEDRVQDVLSRKNEEGDFTKLLRAYSPPAVENTDDPWPTSLPGVDPIPPELTADAEEADDEPDITASPIVQNIWHEENRRKLTDFPYPVTEEEFFENAGDLPQQQMTFWEQDELLIEEPSGEMVYDIEKYVGEANLANFEDISEDGQTIYIFNPHQKTYYEISRETGKYGIEVAGFVEHEDRPGSHKTPRFQM